MKRVCILLLALALLLPACGQAGPGPEAETTTERSPEPLPDDCLLLKGEAADAITNYANRVTGQRGDLMRLSETKGLIVRSVEENEGRAPELWLRDETTGKETVIAEAKDVYTPGVQFIIGGRYVVWTDNFGDNGHGGVYDTQRMADIPWGGEAFPLQLYDNALWFIATRFNNGGPLCLYRAALDGLGAAERIDLGANLLEAIPEAALDCGDLLAVALSPDCRYFAARGTDFGIYIFDLQANALARQIPNGALPGPLDTPDPVPWLEFIDSNTLWCYGPENPDVLEITLP